MQFLRLLQGFRNHPDRFARFWRPFHLGAATAGVLALFCTQSAQAFDFDRPLDRGGHIDDYALHIATSSGKRHVIAGDCMSACTMWLGARNSCVAPDAVLWFHAATDQLQSLRGGNPWRAISPSGNQALLRAYPPRVRAVVAPWLESPDYHTLTGVQLASLGVPLCRQQDLAGGD